MISKGGKNEVKKQGKWSTHREQDLINERKDKKWEGGRVCNDKERIQMRDWFGVGKANWEGKGGTRGNHRRREEDGEQLCTADILIHIVTTLPPLLRPAPTRITATGLKPHRSLVTRHANTHADIWTLTKNTAAIPTTTELTGNMLDTLVWGVQSKQDAHTHGHACTRTQTHTHKWKCIETDTHTDS